mmetsp:Transcript_5596/g.8353  ORF Transcript_5596/g.8353 Transcript_5596/m.8353 type:complete len:88 (+) Transcript_5596:990-1253(+)
MLLSSLFFLSFPLHLAVVCRHRWGQLRGVVTENHNHFFLQMKKLGIVLITLFADYFKELAEKYNLILLVLHRGAYPLYFRFYDESFT